jgi:TM2 domain-containing membrane protein YozV
MPQEGAFAPEPEPVPSPQPVPAPGYQAPPAPQAAPQPPPQPGYQVPPQQPYGYQPPQQPYGYQQQPYVDPSSIKTTDKDRIVAGLLGIFLGTLGIHKFYLGYRNEGLIMLLVSLIGSCITFGLSAVVMEVIGIIEGIMYLTKSQQEFEQLYVYNRKAWF